jgi:anaerobic ribonucleoside-triphosphate reductase
MKPCPAERQIMKKLGRIKKVQCEVYSRVVGYYRPVNSWNEGKKAEFQNRKMFDLGKERK